MAIGGYRPGSGRKKGYAAIEREKAREYLVGRIAEELNPIVSAQIEAAKAYNHAAKIAHGSKAKLNRV